MSTELILLTRVSYRGQEINGPRLRGLLALLARDLRTGCGTSRLVDELWPDEQPEHPTKALRVLVSRMRAQLGPDVIVSTPTGYRLSLSEDQVDSSAVLRSVSAGAQHSRTGDHGAALAQAEAGLALWEGPPSRDVLDPEDPVSALRAERAATYGMLLRARAVALSRLGRREEAAEPLTGLFLERPRDEEVLLELLRCEAETVGASAALARYDTYRRTLREELGVDPGGALRALHQELLRGESPVIRHGVAHEPNELLGRDGDIAAVTKLVRSSRVTSIVGAGGLGKTRLAHAVSRRAEERVVHFVGLTGATSDDDVVGEVASILGIGEFRRTSVSHLVSTDVLTGIVEALSPGAALLVLDNCEHVIGGAAELVRTLVSMTRDLRVLTTSRAPLGLSSESVYPLPELTLATAVELFGRRAEAARPGADLSPAAVAEVCRHLDGLPLAVELAAARVRVMSVTEISRRLKDRFVLLRGGARDAPQRHHTLYAVVDWSWTLLDPAGQAALRALSVFPGGFTADAAQQLLADGGLGSENDVDVLGILEHLVDQSLLKAADTPLGTRFRMLETVREFSAEHREASGETERVTRGFLAWASDFGVRHHDSPFGGDPFSAGERIRAEQDNLVHALRTGLDQEDAGTVAATAAVLGSLWTIEGNYTRMATLAVDTSRLLSHFRPPAELVEVARTTATLCAVDLFMMRGPRAMRSLAVLRRLPQAPPDTLIRATAKLLAAAPELLGPDHRALSALCDSDEPLLAGVARGVASFVWESGHDLDRALVAAERFLEAFENRQAPLMAVMAHSRISELCLVLGRGDEAGRHLKAALLVREELGEWSDPTGIRWGLVLAGLQSGAVEEAEYWLEQATLNQPDDTAGAFTPDLGARAEISIARGEAETGLRLWRRAVERLTNGTSPETDALLEPWALEIQAVTVVAHAQHGRIDLVEEISAQLQDKLWAMLSRPVAESQSSLTYFPVCGALLLALAMADIERGRGNGDTSAARSGARLIALAERFRFVRNFKPTMAGERARHAAEQADRPAYEEAIASYAGLRSDELRTAALAAVRARRL